MEDALISPIGFMILSGAGLTEGTEEEKIKIHKTEQTDKIVVGEDDVKITLTHKPVFRTDNSKGVNKDEDYIYVMLLDGNGEVVSEPYIPSSVDGDTNTITLTATNNDLFEGEAESWTEGFDNVSAVLVDYYYEEVSASQIDITPEELGGNFYLEAETLFRDRNGVDMPAIFTIPNCRVQSNFTFSMAATGDPSELMRSAA